jgi:hypothetical protein
MRGVHRYSLTCTAAPLTRMVALLAIAFAITVPSIAVARATDAAAPVHQCGVVQHTVGVVEQGGVSCSQARAVARQWLAGHNHPDGFACHRKKTDAGSGFQGVCTNQTKRVTIIPQ